MFFLSNHLSFDSCALIYDISITGRYFMAILKSDQETYRGDSSTPYTIPTTVIPTDAWQLEVDNLIGDATA